MWIFGSARRDIGWLVAPGLITLALAWTLPDTSPVFVLFAYVTLYAIDSGHGYATGLRTYFLQTETTRGWLAFYIAAPIAIFFTAMVCLHGGVPYFWTFVVYMTVFHHIRQFYGILRWYEKLNNRYDTRDHFLLYALIAVPMLLFHGRNTAVHGHFVGNELLHIDSVYLLIIGIPAYWALLAGWCASEIRQILRREWRINRFLALALPAGLSGISFLMGYAPQEVLFPMLVSHGVAYIGLTGLSMNKLRPKPIYKTLLASCLGVAVVAACLGVAEHYYEEAFVYVDYGMLAQSWGLAALTALVVTPPLTHYLLDAFIWRGDHPDAKIIYAR